MTTEQIEKFKSIVGGYCWAQDGGNGGYEWIDVEKFISEAIRESRKNILEEVKGGATDLIKKVYDHDISATESQANIEYNQAIIDILEQLQQLGE